jgi:hypothetical protein
MVNENPEDTLRRILPPEEFELAQIIRNFTLYDNRPLKEGGIKRLGRLIAPNTPRPVFEKVAAAMYTHNWMPREEECLSWPDEST